MTEKFNENLKKLRCQVMRSCAKFHSKMVKKYQLYACKRINNIMVIYGYKRIM